MSFEQYYPGGGGKKGKKPSLKPDKKKLRKRATGLVGVVLNPAKLKPVVEAVKAIEKAAENNTALDLPGEATATIEKKLKGAANKAPNPLTRNFFKVILDAFKKAQTGAKEATEAVVDLTNAVTETTGAINDKHEKVVSESPGIGRLPPGEQKKAKVNTNAAGSQIGDPSSGEGGGAGGGKGTGEGEGEGAGSAGKTTYNFDQFLKNYDSKKGFGDQTDTIIQGVDDLAKLYIARGFTKRYRGSSPSNRRLAVLTGPDGGLFPDGEGVRTIDQILAYIKKWKKKKGTWSFQESKDVSLNDVLREYKEKELNDKFNKLIKGMVK